MKATLNRDSIKQKEIVKATIFLTIGVIYLLWNLTQTLSSI